ncbi:LysE family translocator [Vibrio sp. T187]|uniref:LysE family translocator n=1 Tax=Vibrio TaxID=662 RepID=UPI0010C94DF9|nr:MULTISPECIES: LysE family translocator [Vibrio]MBW3696709.1 LysE family translocator [Vibrio sp. T187]
MTITTSIALFIAMLLSAAIPGPSVLAVVSRSLSLGFRQGLLVVCGVVIADYVFIFLALSGLSAISTAMGEYAFIIKYLGVSYLFWLAYNTWLSSNTKPVQCHSSNRTKASSLFVGLVMTLANPKAILFYMGFLPAFIELNNVTTYDVATVLVVSTLAVGGVLSVYAYLASHLGTSLIEKQQSKKWLNKVSAGFLATCGVLLAGNSQ